MSCRNTNPDLPWEQKTLWGQYYTDTKGLQQGIWRWDGMMFEHMKSGDYGKFYQHPFFKQLDVTRVRACYRQMMAKPEGVCYARFYHAGLVSERRGR